MTNGDYQDYDDYGEDDAKTDEHDLSVWESNAVNAVEFVLDDAQIDEIRGTVMIKERECRSLEEALQLLDEIYDEQWYAYVPFDSGAAVFDSDSQGFIERTLGKHGIWEFFEQTEAEEEEGRLILRPSELLLPGGVKILRIDVEEIGDELISFLVSHPEYMRELPSRKFEVLVAELFRRKGYEVMITPRTRDGGMDVIAIQKNELGTALTIIECKRYAEDHLIGVGIVRSLYGVVEAERATKGIIATTSFFSKPAKAFQEKLKYRIDLADFDAMRELIRKASKRR